MIRVSGGSHGVGYRYTKDECSNFNWEELSKDEKSDLLNKIDSNFKHVTLVMLKISPFVFIAISLLVMVLMSVEPEDFKEVSNISLNAPFVLRLIATGIKVAVLATVFYIVSVILGIPLSMVIVHLIYMNRKFVKTTVLICEKKAERDVWVAKNNLNGFQTDVYANAGVRHGEELLLYATISGQQFYWLKHPD